MAAAEDSSFKELFEDLDCPICLESLTDPRALRCQHIFCLKCLIRLADGGHVIVCPECRKETVPPVKNKIATLPRPVLLNKLREKIAKILRPPKGSAFTCDLCEDRLTAAITRCQHCMRNMCRDCEQRHHSTPLFAVHSTLPLTEQSLCEKHTREMLTVFCEQCKAGICVKCAITDHRNHSMRDLNVSVARKYEQLIQWSDNFQKIIDKHEEEMASHASLVLELDEKHAKLGQEIQTWFDESSVRLAKKKIDLLDELETKKIAEQQKVEAYEKEIKELFESKCTLKEFINEMRKEWTTPEQSDIASFTEGLPEVAMMPETVKVPSVLLPPFNPPSLDEFLAKVHFGAKKIGEESQGAAENKSKRGPKPLVHTPNLGATGGRSAGRILPSGLTKLMDIPVNLKKSKSVYGTDEHETFIPHYLVSWCPIETEFEPIIDVGYNVIKDEYHIATMGHILTLNAKGQECNRLETEHRGFCYDHKRNLFVSVRSIDSQIVFLKSDGVRVVKLSVSGLFSGACISHITYCTKNDSYIMTDSLKNKVKIMDARSRDIVHKFKGDYGSRMHHPTFVTCDCTADHSHNLIAVCDRGNNQVRLYGINGEARGCYGNGYLLKPCGLCFDRDSRLLVCDTGNQRILRFSPLESNSFETILRQRDFYREFIYPNAVALTPDGRMIVSTYSNDGEHMVQIFGGYYQ